VIKACGVLKGYGLQGKVGAYFGKEGLDNDAMKDGQGKALVRGREREVEHKVTEERKLDGGSVDRDTEEGGMRGNNRHNMPCREICLRVSIVNGGHLGIRRRGRGGIENIESAFRP
jgi:hypothetical protein